MRAGRLITLGVLPAVPKEKVKPVGNAAGKGALLCLLSEEHYRRAEELKRHIHCLELALSSDFQKRFIEAMKFGLV
jgi:uncharacterized 2Fe-2S/4Fe-4S cluster protein (DUF4445 family)